MNLEDLASKTPKYSAADISTICEDALRKNIVDCKSRIKNEDIIWAIREQKRRKDVMLKKL